MYKNCASLLPVRLPVSLLFHVFRCVVCSFWLISSQTLSSSPILLFLYLLYEALVRLEDSSFHIITFESFQLIIFSLITKLEPISSVQSKLGPRWWRLQTIVEQRLTHTNAHIYIYINYNISLHICKDVICITVD